MSVGENRPLGAVVVVNGCHQVAAGLQGKRQPVSYVLELLETHQPSTATEKNQLQDDLNHLQDALLQVRQGRSLNTRLRTVGNKDRETVGGLLKRIQNIYNRFVPAALPDSAATPLLGKVAASTAVDY